MTTDFPTASLGSSQAPTDAVEKSPEPQTQKSGHPRLDRAVNHTNHCGTRMELRLRLATSGQRHIGSPQIFGSFRRRRQKPYPHFATKAALFLSKLSIPEFLTTLLSHALAFTHSHLGFYQQFLVRITFLDFDKKSFCIVGSLSY
ncbi:MAG: hypothetical protein PHO55_11880 [Thiomonas arsenitoxydans]|nr:hypothetical protein [Thiomonas arsenitoxydans]